MSVLLEVEGLHAGYGPVNVLEDVSLTVGEGETVALLGANGAGKTTTLRAICGMVKPRGSVRIGGRDVSKQSTERIVRLGVAHVPEGRGTFAPLTVEENLRLGAYSRRGKRLVQACLRALPAPGGAPRPAGRDAQRRRAADARDRPRADAASRS